MIARALIVLSFFVVCYILKHSHDHGTLTMTGSISEPLDRLEVLVTKSPHKNIIEMEIEKEKEAGAGDELVFQATSCASFPTLSSTKNTRMTRVAD